MNMIVERKIENRSGFKFIEKVNDKLYVIRWNYQEILDNPEALMPQEPMGSWMECKLNHKPTPAEAKSIIDEYINDCFSRKIQNNFMWKGIRFSLTTVNQSNYKANYDLAVQTSGANLPYTVKGKKHGKTQYITFNSVDEIQEFYIAMQKHINKCLTECWETKDCISVSDYNI